MAVEIASAYVTLIPSLAGAQAAIAEAIVPGATAAGATAGGMMGGSLLGALKAALPVVLVVAAVGSLYAIGDTFHAMESTIRVGTGETGAALDDLVASAKNVGTKVPSSFADIGTTIAGLHERLGLTGPVLETLARQFITAGRITKESLDIPTLTAAFSIFNITGADTSAALDTLFQVSQATGVSINALSDSVKSGAPVLQQFGFSFADSAALMGTMDKAGIANSTTLMALKIGLVNFAKAGLEPQQALKDTIGQIENFTKAGNDAAALTLAAKIFGTRGATQFVAAVKSGTLNLNDLMAAAGAGNDTILTAGSAVSTFASKFAVLKNNVLVGLEPIAIRVFKAFGDGMQWINDRGIPIIKEFSGWLSDNVVPVLVTVGGYITGTVVPAVDRFIQGFKDGTGAGGGFRDFLVLLYNDAIKPIGDFLIGTAIPAVQTFVQQFRDGEGSGGKFRDILQDIYNNGIVPLASFITGTFLPDLKKIEDWILGSGGTQLGSLKQYWEDHKGAIKALAGIITVILLPAFAVAATDAVASAATQVSAWVASKVAAVDSAIFQYGANVSIVTGWVMSAGAAIADGAIIVAIWAMLKWDAIKSAAAMVAAMVTMDVQWLVSSGKAAISAASQVASHVFVAISGWGVQAAAAVTAGAIIAEVWLARIGEAIAGAASTVVSFGIVAAGWISTAATAMASGITMAAAWVIGLGPIAWIIAGVAALVAAFVWAYNNVKWFKDGVDVEWALVVAGVAWMKDQWTTNFNMVTTVLAAAADFILNGFARIADGFATMLGALGNVPGFGWATEAADKMLDAASKAQGFADAINAIPNSKSIEVSTTFYSQAVQTPSWAMPKYAAGTNSAQSGVALVGENGPELVRFRGGEQVIPNSRIDSGRGDKGQTIIIQGIQDIEQIVAELPRLQYRGAA